MEVTQGKARESVCRGQQGGGGLTSSTHMADLYSTVLLDTVNVYPAHFLVDVFRPNST